MIYSDFFKSCDLCCKETLGTDNLKDLKEETRALGWKRKRIDGVLRDICPICFKKFYKQKPEKK